MVYTYFLHLLVKPRVGANYVPISEYKRNNVVNMEGAWSSGVNLNDNLSFQLDNTDHCVVLFKNATYFYCSIQN